MYVNQFCPAPNQIRWMQAHQDQVDVKDRSRKKQTTWVGASVATWEWNRLSRRHVMIQVRGRPEAESAE